MSFTYRRRRSALSAQKLTSGPLRPTISSGVQPKVSLKLSLISTNAPSRMRDTQIGSGLAWNRVANFSSEADRRCSRCTRSLMSIRMPAMRNGLPCSSRYSLAVLSR
ncbi:hypothetical protein D9M68_964300 [compost metagenome]